MLISKKAALLQRRQDCCGVSCVQAFENETHLRFTQECRSNS